MHLLFHTTPLEIGLKNGKYSPHWTDRVSVSLVRKHLGRSLKGPYNRTCIFNRSLNGQDYVNFLHNDFVELLEDIPLATQCCIWIHQNCDLSHCALSARNRNVLIMQFPNRWLEKQLINWSARSPNLTKWDFFRSVVKNEV